MVEFGRIPSGVLLFFYGSMGMALLWLMSRYKKDLLAVLIILFFSTGVVSSLGKNAINAYKILTLVLTIYLMFKSSIFIKLNSKLNLFIVFFGAFIAVFLYASFVENKDDILLGFAQLNRYLIPFILFFVFRQKAFKNINSIFEYNKLFYQLFVFQIIFAILQYLIIGQIEQICGMFTGGAIGTSIPIIGLLWIGLNTNLKKLRTPHWFFMVGLLISGFVAGKRAVWLVFPVVFLVFGVYVAKQKNMMKYLKYLALAPLFLFFGLKLTPTLNPDHKVWGSFDPEYAYNYITDYSLGKENKSTGDRGVGSGRIGANKLLWQYIIGDTEFDGNYLFGHGSLRVYAADKKYYRDTKYNFGVDSKGSLTGAFQLFIAFGLLGLITFLSYYFSQFAQVNYKRLYLLFMIVAIYDFILYAGTIAREPALSVLFAYLIVYSNYQYNSSGQYRGASNIDFLWKKVFAK